MNIDAIIFIGFLVINTLVGIFAGTKNKTIADYALGDRKFGTGAIAGTLIATWIGAGFFLFSVSKVYTSGLPFFTAVVGNGLMLLLLAIFYIPRMKSFLGSLSIADAMGKMYGKKMRVITATAAICLAVGYVGLQIKVLSNLVSWITGTEGIYIVLICSAIVTTYSAFGGIKAVVYTDLVQFFTFGVFVPIIAFILWNSLDNTQMVYDVVTSEQFLDYEYLFSFGWFTMFVWFFLPDMDPSIFQRILMAKDTRQASKAFSIASIACLAIILFSGWLAILALATGKDLNPDEIINHIIHNYSYKGLIGLTAAGIAAMVMSTVDSYINTSAVLFSEDICKTFGIRLKNELSIAKIFSSLAGVVGVFIALSGNNLFDITLTIANFYVPIVTAPMTLAIFGFRTTSKSAIIGVIAGIVTVILWKSLLADTGIDSVIPGLFANFICLISSHYILRQKGGWIGSHDKQDLIVIRQKRIRLYNQILSTLKEFNLKNYLLSLSPKTESIYVTLGFFALVSTITSMYFFPDRSNDVIVFFYQSVLTISVMFITYPIWPATVKNTKILPLTSGLLSTYILVTVGTYMLLVSSFGTIHLVTFMANLLVIAILFEWQFAIFAIIIGIYVGYKIYIFEYTQITGEMGTIQFKIMYALLVISAALIAFMKPKQDHQELTEEKVEHLNDRIGFQEHELVQSQELKHEFLRNLQHEARTPITGITSLAQILDESYDKFTPEQIRKSIKQIAESSERLTSLVNNMIDVSKLSSLSYELKKELVNLTELIYDRLERCKRIYLGSKNLEIVTDINPDIKLECDSYYIGALIDNLIVNAIKYSKEGVITITLRRAKNEIQFSISDNGIGIPKHELLDIFGAFVVSSKTRTPAGGRGVGLALCKKVIELHGGKIWAESNGTTGAVFRFVIPVN